MVFFCFVLLFFALTSLILKKDEAVAGSVKGVIKEHIDAIIHCTVYARVRTHWDTESHITFQWTVSAVTQWQKFVFAGRV